MTKWIIYTGNIYLGFKHEYDVTVKKKHLNFKTWIDELETFTDSHLLLVLLINLN